MKRLLITYHNVFKIQPAKCQFLYHNMKAPVYYVLFIMCSVVRLSSEILCIVSCRLQASTNSLVMSIQSSIRLESGSTGDVYFMCMGDFHIHAISVFREYRECL